MRSHEHKFNTKKYNAKCNSAHIYLLSPSAYYCFQRRLRDSPPHNLDTTSIHAFYKREKSKKDSTEC